MLLALVAAPGCFGPRSGPVSGASADPNAAAAATARKDWRDAADRWYSVYLVDQGRDPKAILETARALFMLGDSESANNMIDLGLRKHTDNVDLIEMKADILVAMGFRRPAERYYQRVLDKEPQRRSALLSIGRARIQLGLEAAAVAPLQQLVATGGDYESYSLLARALKGSGDPGGAYLAWKNAFQYPGANVEDMLTASALSLDAGVRRTHPGAAAECTAWLEQAISLDPQCSSAHFQLGLLAEETGAIDAAIEHYRRAVELEPSCLIALTNLAILYSGRNDEVRTREMVQRALQFELSPERRRALLRLLDPFDRKADEKP
ncbi:MAG: tetratricopeptide repeat protein [Planctomycetes bacterium]|nr:tetratricopeptide repeat protein [Planctomycetota bacterium]